MEPGYPPYPFNICTEHNFRTYLENRNHARIEVVAIVDCNFILIETIDG